MTIVSFIPFKDPRRERCGLCRQRLALAYLLLIRDGGRIAGEMELCAKCALLLRNVVTMDGEQEDMIVEEEAGK